MKKVFALILGTSFLLCGSKAFSQIFISFLTNTGAANSNVPSESTSPAHMNETEIMSLSSGFSNPAAIGAGTSGMSAGKVSISDISFMKPVGKLSSALIAAICKGTHYDKIEVRFYANNPVGGKPYRYLVIGLDQVRISSLKQSASGNEKPTEDVSLAFAKISWNYFEPDATGKIVPSGTASWDITTQAQ